MRFESFTIRFRRITSICRSKRTTAGIRGLGVRVARRLNGRVLQRRGPFFECRYHRHDLGTPREVRHALIYVRAMTPLATAAGASPVRAPETWLLRTGWTKVFPGHILLSEVPNWAARRVPPQARRPRFMSPHRPRRAQGPRTAGRVRVAAVDDYISLPSKLRGGLRGDAIGPPRAESARRGFQRLPH